MGNSVQTYAADELKGKRRPVRMRSVNSLSPSFVLSKRSHGIKVFSDDPTKFDHIFMD